MLVEQVVMAQTTTVHVSTPLLTVTPASWMRLLPPVLLMLVARPGQPASLAPKFLAA